MSSLATVWYLVTMMVDTSEESTNISLRHQSSGLLCLLATSTWWKTREHCDDRRCCLTEPRTEIQNKYYLVFSVSPAAASCGIFNLICQRDVVICSGKSFISFGLDITLEADTTLDALTSLLSFLLYSVFVILVSDCRRETCALERFSVFLSY